MTRRRSIRRSPGRSSRRDARRPDRGDDVREQPQPVVAAPLGVELDAEQVAPGDRAARTAGRGSSSASDDVGAGPVGGARRRSGRSRSRRRGAIPANAGWSRRRSTWFQPMWGSVGASVEPSRPARQHAERRRAVLVAALEQELEAEADPEERPAGGDPVADRLDEPGPLPGAPSPAPPRRRRARRARRRPARSSARVARTTSPRRRHGQRLVDADEVAGAVVDDREPGRAPARPEWRRSSERALRRGHAPAARIRLAGGAQRPAERLERGLGQVVVVPAGAADVERRAGRPGERLERVLDELERQLADPLAAERQVDRRRTAGRRRRGPRSRRDSSIGTVASPKRTIPARSPSASANAAPRTSATSSTVWCSSTSRSPRRPDLEVEQAVVGERAEQVVVEADAGRDRRRRPSRRGRA